MKKLIQLSLVAVLLLSVAFGLFQATRYTAAPAITSSCYGQGLLHSRSRLHEAKCRLEQGSDPGLLP